MSKKLILIITIIFMINLINIFGNYPINHDIRFEHINQMDGLSQGSINCMTQDKNGFMWFGTQSGLNKYDGYKFEVFLNDPDDQFSISFNYITALFEDIKGDLWVGTQNGLNRFITSEKRFVRYYSSSNINSISNNTITAICEDKNGDIWVGTPNGLNRYNYKNNNFKRYINNNKEGDINNIRISSLFKDKNGILWIGTIGGGINKYIEGKDAFINYESRDNNVKFITTLFEDHSGEFWIGTFGRGIAIFKRKKKDFVFYNHKTNDPKSLSHNRINFIFESKNNMLWVGTPNGLNRFNRREENFYIYKSNVSNAFSLSFNMVSAMFEDNNGILWIGTLGRGLNKFTKRSDFFKKHIPEPQNPNSLSNSFVYSIIEDKKKNLWVGTQGGGINKINRELNQFSFYRFNRSDGKSISSDYISCLFEDKEDNIWIGTFGNGINKYIKKENSFKRYIPGINAPGAISNVKYILESDKSPGVLWLATAGSGLVKFNKKKELFELFFTSIGRESDPSSVKFKNMHENLNSNTIYFLYEAPSKPGYIFVSTDKGLSGFNFKNNKIEAEYTVKDGLPDNVIYAVLEDSNGFLWLSTNKGISKFNIENNTFLNYDIEDGLQGMEFNGVSAFKNSSGEMFFGGTNGFNSFFPDKIIKNKKIPAIYITDFKVFNESIKIGKNSTLKKDICEVGKIILPYYKNTFTFEFVALDYTAPRKNKYAYKLDNFDKVWHFVDYKKRSAQYMNINPGEYIFRVKGSNSDGVWNETGVEIKLIINPPFWNTWSFRISTFLLILLIFLILYKKRMSNVSSRLRLETELSAAHNAQMSIMPQSDPNIEGYEISGLCIPASEVGGDFYDYLWLDENRSNFGIAIGDVSGKAMKAAMTAIMTNGILFSQASESNSIKDIMTKINKPIYLKTEKQVFTALCLVSININSKIMSFTNAGLSEPIIKSGNSVTRIKQKGIKFPLGIKKDSKYLENDIQLKSGDTLLLYTDGVSEAMNTKDELYGTKRLMDLIKGIETKEKSPKEIINIIMSNIGEFSNGEPQRDDITIVIMKVK